MHRQMESSTEEKPNSISFQNSGFKGKQKRHQSKYIMTAYAVSFYGKKKSIGKSQGAGQWVKNFILSTKQTTGPKSKQGE